MNKFAAMAERTTQLIAALAAVGFFVSGVVYLWFGHWPVTHLDYWGFYEIYLKHTWLQSAFSKNAEHFMLFPTLLFLADLRFFHGDQELLFLVGLVLLMTTAALLLIPVWRDQSISLTARIMATLGIVMGNFWMARSPITASGGFNCICSLLMASVALAFLFLPRINSGLPGSSSATLTVVCASFVSSFSFGVGLAIWPTLLFLAWCLRLPKRSLWVVGISAIAAVIIYQAMPHLNHYAALKVHDTPGLELVGRLCRLVGGPFLYGAAAWHQNSLSTEAAQSSILSLWCGAAGLGLAILAMASALLRRDLREGLKFTGIALVAFNVVVMIIITVGNYFRGLELGFIAPRYLFWSTLFWTGLFLMAIACADLRQWLRWSVCFVALALPIAAFPMHYKSGLKDRWVRTRAEYGAVTLINGVHDESQLRIFGGDTKHVFAEAERVYRVADQLRAHRLDMFARGLQDWIGHNETELFGDRRKLGKLEGGCRVTALVQCDNGAPAARIVGHATLKRHLPRIMRWAISPVSWIAGQEFKDTYSTPRTLVIVDQGGVVRGIARCSPTSSVVNRMFYLGNAPKNEFSGYIRDYNPKKRYKVRSADAAILSERGISVQPRRSGSNQTMVPAS